MTRVSVLIRIKVHDLRIGLGLRFEISIRVWFWVMTMFSIRFLVRVIVWS